MIVVYSELKKLLPDLVAKGQDLADTFALIGHFCSGYKKDGLEEIYDLEVRAANRPDCLGYLGLARDLAAFYQISVIKPRPATEKPAESNNSQKINIQITAKNYVKALSACLITNLQISNSPDWLVKLLSYHSINSVNNLVDLTNYIMLLYGIPCHAFDANSVEYSLNWTTSKQSDIMTTFDGTKLVLPVGTLVIEGKNSIASLSTIGGQKTGINKNSSNTILEMAIYDPAKVHTDSQILNVQTEARSRLEKILSPAEIPEAFLHLQSLVLEYCHGEITEQFLDFQNFIPNNLQIKFDPESPAKYAGTNIPTSTSIRILENLGCQVSSDFFVTPPSWRTDINCQEDLIEEVVRIYGYNHIPTDEPIDQKQLSDITPVGLNLAISTANILASLGYDEIRSWTLIQEKYLLKNSPNAPVRTENNINEEYPFLRQSLISSLIKQADIYSRYLLPKPKFFEIGKVFSKKDSGYLENSAVAIFCQNKDELDQTVNTIIKTLELDTSKIATTTHCDNNGYYLQMILDEICSFKNFSTQPKNTNAIELTTQVQSFDATISFDTEQEPENLISSYSKKISSTILWSMLVKDYYHDPKQKKHNYTLTAYYYNCTSQEAKSTHLKAFGLTIKSIVSGIMTKKGLSPYISNKNIYLIDNNADTVLEYYSSPYLQEDGAIYFSSKKYKDHWVIICDKTIFYPTGGGQPGDTGTIENIQIFNTTFENGQVLHHTHDEVNLKIGQKVKQVLNWPHRYKYMQIHSAGHLLHDTIISLGFNVKAKKGDHGDDAWILYNGKIDPNSLLKITQTYSKHRNINYPIITDYIADQDLERITGMSAGNLPKHKRLRYLKIGPFAEMPDGGVQVKNTSELPDLKLEISYDSSSNETLVKYCLD